MLFRFLVDARARVMGPWRLARAGQALACTVGGLALGLTVTAPAGATPAAHLTVVSSPTTPSATPAAAPKTTAATGQARPALASAEPGAAKQPLAPKAPARAFGKPAWRPEPRVVHEPPHDPPHGLATGAERAQTVAMVPDKLEAARSTVSAKALEALTRDGKHVTATAQAFCQDMTHRLPNLSAATCARAQLSPIAARSSLGRPLFQRDVIADNAHLRVLVVGGIHGDELSSTSLVMHWISEAIDTPSNIHWRFVPLMNPDGMMLDKPTRTNASGVDLNRNFPTPNWDKEAAYYWNKRTRKDPRRYPGPKPLSEPESRWLYNEMEHWKPDLIVSVHAPYGVLDFDGPTVPPERLGRLYLDQVGIYPGSLGNYGGVHKKVPVVTIELPSAIRTPQEAEIRQMWLDLLRWTAERLGAG